MFASDEDAVWCGVYVVRVVTPNGMAVELNGPPHRTEYDAARAAWTVGFFLGDPAAEGPMGIPEHIADARDTLADLDIDPADCTVRTFRPARGDEPHVNGMVEVGDPVQISRCRMATA